MALLVIHIKVYLNVKVQDGVCAKLVQKHPETTVSFSIKTVTQ